MVPESIIRTSYGREMTYAVDTFLHIFFLSFGKETLGKLPLGRSKRREGDNITMGLTETDSEGRR
jgi:hypothetical protein